LHGDAVISLVFASFENGAPMVLSLSFQIDKNGTPLHPDPTILETNPKGLSTGMLGYHTETDAALKSESWQESFVSDPIAAAADLIRREIDASTRDKRFDVGLPICIVGISANVAGWANGYEGECHDNF